MNARRSGPLIAVILALIILPYPMMKLGPMLFSNLATPEAPAGSMFDEWGNPVLSAEDAALEIIPGVMRLGDLVKMMRADSAGDPVAHAFLDAFKGRPELRDAWQHYRTDKNAKKLQDHLIHSQDFEAMYRQFEQRVDFRSLMTVVKRPDSTTTEESIGSRSPLLGSLPMAQNNGAAAPLQAQTMTSRSVPEGSSGYRTGPGYDGQPQPGEVADAVSLPTMSAASMRSELPVVGTTPSGVTDMPSISPGSLSGGGAQGLGTASSNASPANPAGLVIPSPPISSPGPSASSNGQNLNGNGDGDSNGGGSNGDGQGSGDGNFPGQGNHRGRSRRD